MSLFSFLVVSTFSSGLFISSFLGVSGSTTLFGVTCSVFSGEFSLEFSFPISGFVPSPLLSGCTGFMFFVSELFVPLFVL